MNKENIEKLQKLAKGLSIIYVEDSITLQKQVGRFLGKIFDNFYQAYDGLDGFEKYKSFKPDIVLTDLTMPKKNGLEMIIDIKEVNPDVKIIVLSAHNDDMTLLETIDLGIVEFLKKPVDLDKLTEGLNEAILLSDNLSNQAQCLHDIRIVFEQNIQVGFINTFKGMPIQNDGKIVGINNDEIIVQVPKMQIIAMKTESHTVMKFKSTNRHMQVYVLKIDEKLNLITLTKPNYINFTMREFKYKRIAVDKTFKVGLHIHNHNIDIRAIDVSFISISMYTENHNTQIKLNDEIDLTLGFEINSPTVVINEKKFTKIFTKAKVIRMMPYKSGLQLVASLNIKKADDSTFRKYLQDREIEILQEFKSLLKR
ncbi:MAG: response regulator [Campylobacterota bacterium]|nr:response regulator [Campylobacterota bacterium]